MNDSLDLTADNDSYLEYKSKYPPPPDSGYSFGKHDIIVTLSPEFPSKLRALIPEIQTRLCVTSQKDSPELQPTFIHTEDEFDFEIW